MAFTDEELNAIYDRTSGYCHVCGKKLAITNYARPGRRGAWEVEHSHPRARGGTDRLNNLYPACITCNREKGTRSSRAARHRHGRRRAPLSRPERKRAKAGNALVGGAVGTLVGSLVGPTGMLLGAAIGAKIGYDKKPDR